MWEAVGERTQLKSHCDSQGDVEEWREETGLTGGVVISARWLSA